MYSFELQRIANEIALTLPDIIGALIVLVIGWIIALIVAGIARHALLWMGIDGWLAKSGVNKTPQSSKTRPSNIIAAFIKWLIILGAAGVAAEILNLASVSAFIGSLIAYVPNILVAAVILIIGFIAAQRVSELVDTSSGFSRIPEHSRLLISKAAKYAIIVFAVMAALTQLNIVPRLIEIAFAGLVFAAALAFGLGGREHANEFIAKMKDKSRA